MRYAILVLSSPSAGACNLSAARFVKAALAAGHSVPRVFFSDEGTQTGLASANYPQDEASPRDAWVKLAAEHKVELVVCITSALQRGVLNSDEAARHESVPTLHDAFTIGGLGLLIEATAAAERTITFGG